MKPVPSPLDCVAYFVTDLSVKANQDYDPEAPTQLEWDDVEIESDCSPRTDEAGGWQISLKVIQNLPGDRNVPYNYSVTLVGMFQIPQHLGIENERQEKLVKINGSSVLYSVAREVLRGAMAKGPFMPVMLPTVSFYNPTPTDSEQQIPKKKNPSPPPQPAKMAKKRIRARMLTEEEKYQGKKGIKLGLRRKKQSGLD